MEKLRKLLHLSCAAVILLAAQANADVDTMATEKYVDDSVADATNATYQAAVRLTKDATNELAKATLPNDFNSLTNNPAFTNAVAHVSPKVEVVAPTDIAENDGKAADAKLTGIALTNRYTKSETDANLAGKANEVDVPQMAKDAMSSEGIASSGINIGGNISGKTVSDQSGDLRDGINAKADRADLEDYLPLTGGTLSGSLTVGMDIISPFLKTYDESYGGGVLGGDIWYYISEKSSHAKELNEIAVKGDIPKWLATASITNANGNAIDDEGKLTYGKIIDRNGYETHGIHAKNGGNNVYLTTDGLSAVDEGGYSPNPGLCVHSEGWAWSDYSVDAIHFCPSGYGQLYYYYFPYNSGTIALEGWQSLSRGFTDACTNRTADCECISTNIVNLVKTSKCFSNAVTEAVAGYSAVSNAAMNAVTKDKIVDDLSSHDSSKPLSANMGRALKDSIENTAAQKQDKLPYPTNAIPTRILSGTIPLSSVKNASGQSVGASDVGAYSQQSGAALENIVAQKQTQLNATQLEAVNSGINATKVGTYDGYAAQISGKQDKLPYPTNAIPLSLVKNASGQAVGASDVGAYAQQSGETLEGSVSDIQSSVGDLFLQTSALWDSLNVKVDSEGGYARNTKFDGEIYFGYNDPYSTYVYLPDLNYVYTYSSWGGSEPISYRIQEESWNAIRSSGCLFDGSSVSYGLYFGYGSDLYLDGGWDSIFNYQTYTTLGMVLGEMDQTVNDHIYDNNNPHNITAEQIGAIGSSYISTNNPEFVAQVLATGMQLDPTAIAEFNEACRRGTLESNIVSLVRKYFKDTTSAHYYWDPVLRRTWQIAVSNGCFFGEIVDNDIPH